MRTFIFLLTLFSICLMVNLFDTQTKAAEMQIPTAEEIQKIKAAVPEKPIVTPSKSRKLLICSHAWGYIHDVVLFGQQAFELLGQQTGAYETVTSDDVSLFEPQNLNQFDAVLFNNTNNEIFLPENFDQLSPAEQAKATEYDQLLKKSLVNFLKNGKGLAVLHAGVACFRKWPEYGEIVGARFDNHPWVAGSTVTLKVEEPTHPLVKMFKTQQFQVTDEIYQMTGEYSREKLRVLISIDTSRTDMTVKGIHRDDGDFGMSWIKNYGQGRIFYCALGHEKHIFWDEALLRHFLAGIQFVLGDLACDVQPSAVAKPD